MILSNHPSSYFHLNGLFLFVDFDSRSFFRQAKLTVELLDQSPFIQFWVYRLVDVPHHPPRPLLHHPAVQKWSLKLPIAPQTPSPLSQASQYLLNLPPLTKAIGFPDFPPGLSPLFALLLFCCACICRCARMPSRSSRLCTSPKFRSRRGCSKRPLPWTWFP